jgi:hypothetical protein
MWAGPSSSPPCGTSASPARRAIANAAANSDVAAALVVAQAEPDDLTRPVARVSRREPCQGARLERVTHPGRRDDDADLDRAGLARVARRVEHDLERRRDAADVRRVRRRVDLDLEAARTLGGVVGRCLLDDAAQILLAPDARARCVVEPLEPEPAALVRRHPQRVAVEQRGWEPHAARLCERREGRNAHRPGEVQVQVRLGEESHVTHVVSVPGDMSERRLAGICSGRRRQLPDATDGAVASTRR